MHPNCPTYKQKLKELKDLQTQFQQELKSFETSRKSENIWETRKKIEEIINYFEKGHTATNINEIDGFTKRYIGPWNIEVFNKIKNYPDITEIYEEYPDKKVFMQTLETDPDINSPQKAKEALKKKNIYLTNLGKDILEKTEFSQEKKKYNLVRFTVEQLGLPQGATTDEIHQKVKELGLEFCPAEVGPHLRLQYLDKEVMLIAMEEITAHRGFPSVFSLYGDGKRLELAGGNCSTSISKRWDPGNEFVFLSARKIR